MFEWDLRKRVIAGAIAFGVLSTGLCFALVYQSPAKTDEIYSAALKDFEVVIIKMHIICFLK